MGYSISWCAVREAEAASFLAQVGLSAAGKTEEVPESDRCMCGLDTGWRVVWFNEYDPREINDEKLATLSAARELLVCRVEEHVMASSAEYWSRGVRGWWIGHDGEDGPKGLDLEGEPPPQLAAVRDDLERRQREAGGESADVDHLFDIPLATAREIVGFKHDEGEEHVIGGRYEVLESVRGSGLLARLFGK